MTKEIETESANPGTAALVVGASGGIGAAVLHRYLDDPTLTRVYAVSRGAQPVESSIVDARLIWFTSDYSEASVVGIAEQVTQHDCQNPWTR
jgi:NAD(P)-dependent dehydrogenase (short-subunit alcohol dehydrogenase family)